jgi:hypothetical protein
MRMLSVYVALGQVLVYVAFGQVLVYIAFGQVQFCSTKVQGYVALVKYRSYVG